MKNVLKKSVREELNKLATAYDVHEVDWKKAHPDGYEMQTVTLDDGSTVTKKVTYEDVADPAELEAHKTLKNYKRAGIGAGVVAAVGGVALITVKVVKTIVSHKAEEPEATAIDDEYPIEIDENGNELISHEELNNLGFELKEEEKTE